MENYFLMYAVNKMFDVWTLAHEYPKNIHEVVVQREALKKEHPTWDFMIVKSILVNEDIGE